MNIFDYINDILYKKRGNLIDKKENWVEFNQYLIQRWVSMYSNLNVQILNNTTNILYNAIETKDEWYKLFLTTIPKGAFKRLNYIKKTTKQTKERKKNTDDVIELLAISKKMSKREVREYIEEYNIDISNLIKGLENK